MRLAFVAFMIPALAHAQSVEALVKEVITNEMRHFQTLQEYTAQYEWSQREFSKDGKLTKETSNSGESYASHKRNIDIALMQNGRPLKPPDLAKRKKFATDQLVAHAAERAKNGEPATMLAYDRFGPGSTFFGVHTSSLDVLRLCKLAGPRRETSALVVDFSDCQQPVWKEGFHYPHLRGTIWIDPESRLVQSWKAWVIDGPKAGALFYESETQIAAGGGRVIGFNYTNFAAAPHIFPKMRVETMYRWKNPQRFEVNVGQTIEAPKQ